MLDVIVEHILFSDFAFGFRSNALVFTCLDNVANFEKACVRRDRCSLFFHHLRAVVLFRIVRSRHDYAAGILWRRANRKIDHVGGNAADVDYLHAGIDESVSQSFLQRGTRFARVHADNHRLRMKEIGIGLRDSIEGLLVEIRWIKATNVVSAKAVKVHTRSLSEPPAVAGGPNAGYGTIDRSSISECVAESKLPRRSLI